jgi:hypothetical protein
VPDNTNGIIAANKTHPWPFALLKIKKSSKKEKKMRAA